MFTSTNADKRKAKCAKCHYHNNDYIQVSLYSNAPNAFKSNKSRKQITIQKSNTRPACKVFSTSEVLRGLGGRKGTQRVIYKSLAKVSGSDDNVLVVVVCIRVSICIWIGICVCICLRNLGGGGAPISCSWWSSSLYHLPSQPPSLLMAPALTLMAFLFWLLNH